MALMGLSSTGGAGGGGSSAKMNKLFWTKINNACEKAMGGISVVFESGEASNNDPGQEGTTQGDDNSEGMIACEDCGMMDSGKKGKKSSPKGIGIMKSDNPLRDSKGENVYTLEEFLEYNEGLSVDDIINQRPKNMKMPGGPELRYVLNPVDGSVMDMRHVLVVGYKYGGALGFGVEVLQGLTKKTRPSSMDPQDFYSNKIGHNFFWYVGHRNESFMTRFSFYFKEVLGWKKGGSW